MGLGEDPRFKARKKRVLLVLTICKAEYAYSLGEKFLNSKQAYPVEAGMHHHRPQANSKATETSMSEYLYLSLRGEESGVAGHSLPCVRGIQYVLYITDQ